MKQVYLLTLVTCLFQGVIGADSTLGTKIGEYVTQHDKLFWETDELGCRRNYQYDNMGRLIGVHSNSRPIASYQYDDKGRIISAALGKDAPIQYTYDKQGRFSGSSSPLGHSHFYYDRYSNLIKRDGAGDFPLSFQYDNWGHLIAYQAGNSGKMLFEYDQNGTLRKRIWPDMSETEYFYRNGKLMKTNNAGRITSYEYDAWGRKIKEKTVKGNESITIEFSYDIDGNMIQAIEGKNRTIFEYDRLGRKIYEEGPVGKIHITYDDHGRLAAREVEFHTGREKFLTKYFYDEYDRLTRVVSPAGVFDYVWTSDRKIACLIYNGKSLVNIWENNRLVSRSFDGIPIVQYEYDILGRRISSEYFGSRWKYKYDQYNQLISAEDPQGKICHYAYDKIGNHLELSDVQYTYDTANRIVNDGYAYDVWGNVIKTPDAQLRYDCRNRLIEVIKSNGIKISYLYDSLDQRIGSIVNGKRTSFLMSDMIEYGRNNGKSLFHTLGIDISNQLYATGATGAVLASANIAYLYDGNGNVIASVKDGEIVNRVAYDPFGKQRAGSMLPFSFSTKYVDESGLAYFGYRFYDPAHARWITRDPIEEAGGVNFYAFVNNSPLDKFDIKGLASSDPNMPPFWGLTVAEFSAPVKCNGCCNSNTQESGFCPEKLFSLHFKTTLIVKRFLYNKTLDDGTTITRSCLRTPANISRTTEHEETHKNNARTQLNNANNMINKWFSTETQCKSNISFAVGFLERWNEKEKNHTSCGAPSVSSSWQTEINDSERAGLCQTRN